MKSLYLFVFVLFRHGDMLYLFPTKVEVDGLAQDESSSSSISSSSSTQPAQASVVEDEVDQFLWKQDGKIYRKRDDQL